MPVDSDGALVTMFDTYMSSKIGGLLIGVCVYVWDGCDLKTL